MGQQHQPRHTVITDAESVKQEIVLGNSLHPSSQLLTTIHEQHDETLIQKKLFFFQQQQHQFLGVVLEAEAGITPGRKNDSFILIEF